MENKLLFAGLFFIVILLSGYWLHHLGKPVNVFFLTVHKLISLAALVFLVISLYRINQVTPLSPLEIVLSAVTVFLFIVMIATGGLLSTAKTMPEVIHKLHQIVPYLVILGTAATLYFVMVQKQ